MTPREKIVEEMVKSIPPEWTRQRELIAQKMLQVVLDAVERGEVVEVKASGVYGDIVKIVIKEGIKT